MVGVKQSSDLRKWVVKFLLTTKNNALALYSSVTAIVNAICYHASIWGGGGLNTVSAGKKGGDMYSSTLPHEESQ